MTSINFISLRRARFMIYSGMIHRTPCKTFQVHPFWESLPDLLAGIAFCLSPKFIWITAWCNLIWNNICGRVFGEHVFPFMRTLWMHRTRNDNGPICIEWIKYSFPVLILFLGINYILTLYDPKFFTEHANFTLRPAGTVMFSMTSVNSGSSITAIWKIYKLIYFDWVILKKN